MEKETLYHYGIPGMKWGIRRYQNKDGSLTPAGKKRLAKLNSEVEKLSGKKTESNSDSETKKSSSTEKAESLKINETKKVNEMSDNELRTVVNRLQMEQQYKNLSKPKKTLGQRFIESAFKDVVGPSVREAAKQNLTRELNKAFADAIASTRQRRPGSAAAS